MQDFQPKLRHWSYHRQFLGKLGASAEQVLKDVIGVYSSHPTAPLSLFARTQSFDEQAFSRLDNDRLAYRMPAMRLSVHLLPRETAHLVFAATVPPASDPVWEKRYSQKGRDIPKDKYEGWKDHVLRVADKPLNAKEIGQGSDIADDRLKMVLNRMAYEGSLLRVGANSLRSNIISYVSTKAWADESFVEVDRDKALGWLAGEYLRAFGPVRVKDFQWWAGVTAGQAKKAVSHHDTIDVEDGYLLLAGDLNDFESFKAPSHDSVDILPQWDSYTMGYAPDGRERFVSPDTQDRVYGALGATKGNALGVALVNGMAQGSWTSRFKGSQMIVTLNMFEKPSSHLSKDIEGRFNEIASLLKARSVAIEDEG